MRNILGLFQALLTDRDVATVAPTSPYAVKTICNRMHEGAQCIVEYGPGTGPFTEALLGKLAPGGKLILIEKNQKLAELHREKYHDDRIRLIEGDAKDVEEILSEQGASMAEYVLSGIPFSFLPDDAKHSILRSTYNILSPTGAFLVYQFREDVKSHLEQVFPNVMQHEPIRPNFPRLHFFEASKN